MADFTKNFVAELEAFKESVADIKPEVKYVKYEEFQILVAAVHSLMKHSDFTSIQLKDANGVGAQRDVVQKYLKDNFNIYDNKSANQAIGNACFRGTHWQFAQFDMYNENEDFRKEVDKLRPSAKESFMKCKEFADMMMPVTGTPGFFAWDIALGVELIRESIYIEYYDEPTARKMLEDLMKPLLKSFTNWVDFAVSFVAGGTYSTYKNSGFDIAETEAMFDEFLAMVRRLFEDEEVCVWKIFNWYVKKDYFPTLNKDELEMLVTSEKGCFVSDRISLDGAMPCYAYRETPFKNFPDSGWRFFAGDESREYTTDTENSNIFPLNVIANFDPTIIPLLDAEINTAFIRKDGEEFVEFKTVSDAMKEKSKSDPLAQE